VAYFGQYPALKRNGPVSGKGLEPNFSDADHGAAHHRLPCCLSTTTGGNDPVPRQKGNAMTDLNKEVCELTSDELKIEELDAVTAGSKIGNFIAALRLEILVQYVKAHDSEMMVRELF
jgi:hypothetical protein